MLRRGFLAGMTALAATGAGAQDAASSSSATPATVPVRLKTAKGDVALSLEIERAPITTKNFLKYVDQGRLDGAPFYRAMRMTADLGIIQGGDIARALPGCKHEPTSQTGLTHTEGTISLARGKPGTAQGDFFICVGDMSPYFDAGQDGTDDKLGFAAFGHVTDGMDVVSAIFDSPLSPTRGAGPMKGQMLWPQVRIISARRIKA